MLFDRPIAMHPSSATPKAVAADAIYLAIAAYTPPWNQFVGLGHLLAHLHLGPRLGVAAGNPLQATGVEARIPWFNLLISSMLAVAIPAPR